MSLGDRLASFERRLDDMADAHDNTHRIGFVSDVKYDTDQKRWYVKFQASEDNQNPQSTSNPGADPNFQSKWVPWQTFAHGTISFSFPPRKGMSIALKTPNGRPEMAWAEPFHNNPANPATSDKPDVMAWQVNDPKDSSSSSAGQGGIGSDTAASKHVRQEVSSNDRTLTTPGVTQTTDQATVNEAAKDTMTRSTGSPSLDDQNSFKDGNAPHELNAQLQGLRAEVTQHTHHIAALHDQMSSIIDLAMPKVPQLAALLPFLDHQPQGLQMAADGVLGKLEQYVSFSLQQAVAKLTNSFMGSVMSIAGGNITAQIGQALSQITGLAGASDAAVSTSQALQDAQTTAASLVVPPATAPASGSGGATTTPTVDLSPLLTDLQPIALAFAGTAAAGDVTDIVNGIAALSPASAAALVTVNALMEQLAAIYAANAGPGDLSAAIATAMADAAALSADAFALDPVAIAAALAPVAPAFSGAAASGQTQGLLGQVAGIATLASGFLSGLGGMTDAQSDITKGMIKSYRLGGYGSSS
jgi:hypothetical protein